jgi:FkbM family methyltransferase
MDPSAVNPEIHDQGAELALIAALVPKLGDRSAIDVGSERGSVATALRKSGLDPIWLIEPFPDHVAGLRDRFGSEPGVHVLDIAAGAEDGTANLHLARDRSGGRLEPFNSLHPRSTDYGVAWEGSVSVQVRSLDSLRADGEIPGRVGVLKIDAEGADAEVLRGASGITADVVMVEFWRDLPETVGRCPYELKELRSLVEPLGPRRFLFVRHGRRYVGIGRWDVADPSQGEWGNLIFVADPLVEAAEAALPALDRALSERAERILSEEELRAEERLRLIERLNETAEERLELIERLSRQLEERGKRGGRLRGMLGGARSGGSAEPPPLEPLDDVEQEGGGRGAV